ncbi:hypothetical protein HXX76_013637 [Chlamydomonas incerta]|uniref:MYND-type domain-containing protein n=1 Tax=Chlamydomonas incerta TaxID=51695 RepID=A0A835VU44_CHLIN|nr:hypothetical protein HXX76_013637 [Chlamydomonas incerta]|eukprot:KAG2425594.1 hypothetical protein HXX76_013637 [Chlamydomonas incerta]
MASRAVRAWCSLRHKLALELPHLTLDEDWLAARPGATTTPARYFSGLARTLLGTHTLRAYAALFLDTAAQLQQAFAVQPAGSGAGGSQAGQGSAAAAQGRGRGEGGAREGRGQGRRVVTTALEQLKEGCALLEALWDIAADNDDEAPGGVQPLPLPLPPAAASTQPLSKQLCCDLDESGFVEGWSRLLLMVTSCEAAEDEAPRLLHRMATALEALPSDEWIEVIGHNLRDRPSLSWLISSHLTSLAAAAPPLPEADGACGAAPGSHTAAAAAAGGSGSGPGLGMQSTSAGGRRSQAAQAQEQAHRVELLPAGSGPHCAPLIAADGGPLRLRGHRLAAAINGVSGGAAAAALGSGGSTADDEVVGLVMARQGLHIWQDVLRDLRLLWAISIHGIAEADGAADKLFANFGAGCCPSVRYLSFRLRPVGLPPLSLHEAALQSMAGGRMALLRLQAAMGAKTALVLLQQQRQLQLQPSDDGSSAPTAAAAGASDPSSRAAADEEAVMAMARQAVAVEPGAFKEWMAAQRQSSSSATGEAGRDPSLWADETAWQAHGFLLESLKAEPRWQYLEAMGLRDCARAADLLFTQACVAVCTDTKGAVLPYDDIMAKALAAKLPGASAGGRAPGAGCMVHRLLPGVTDVSLRLASLATALLSRRQQLRQQQLQQQEQQRRMQPLLPAHPGNVTCVLWRALQCARTSLSEVSALSGWAVRSIGGYAAEMPAGAWAERLDRKLVHLDRFWRVALPAATATVSAVQAMGPGGGLSWAWTRVSHLLRLGTPEGTVLVKLTTATPDVEAAVRHGYVRTVERLIRLAAREKLAAAQAFLAELVDWRASFPWALLFLHTPQLDTSSLFVTLAKVMRRAYTQLPGNVTQLQALSDASGGGSLGLPRELCRTVCGLLTVMRRLLGPTVRQHRCIAGIAAEEACQPTAPRSGSNCDEELAAGERLRKVLSVCVTTLLPEVAEAVRRVSMIYEVEPFAVSGDGLLDGITALLAWIPLLCRTFAALEAPPAGLGIATGGGGSSSNSAGGKRPAPRLPQVADEDAELALRALRPRILVGLALAQVEARAAAGDPDLQKDGGLGTALKEALWVMLAFTPAVIGGMITGAEDEAAAPGPKFCVVGETALRNDYAPATLAVFRRVLGEGGPLASPPLLANIQGLWTAAQRSLRGADTGGAWFVPDLSKAPFFEHKLVPGAFRLPRRMLCVASSLLPRCAFPECSSLEGDSEAGTRLLRCSRCDAARYCSAACQKAHWPEHKGKCGRKAPTAARAAAGSSAGAAVATDAADEVIIL